MNEPSRPTYSDTREGALMLLENEVDERIVTLVKEGLASGALALIPDPEHVGVWGIMAGLNREQSVMVLYCLEADHTCDEAYFNWP